MSHIGVKMNTIGRLFLFMLSYIIIAGLFQYIGSLVAGIDFTNESYEETSKELLIVGFFGFLGTFLVIWLFIKFVEKKAFITLGFQTKNRFNEFGFGIILGVVIMLIGYLLLIYLNEITFLKINFDFNELIKSILIFIIVAVVEETLLRGYILRNLMTSFNKYTALIASSLLFSIMHGLNPNVDFFSLFNLFLAGILLGLSYIQTKNLWFPIAMHLSWNLFQTLFGFNVSGKDTYSIIEFNITEENLLNGGAFGFEGSYLSSIAELITIVAIWFYYYKKSAKQSTL